MTASKLPTNLQRRITEAQSLIVIAEEDLAKAIREVTIAERADKMIISSLLQDAFDRLTAARVNLAEILEGKD